MYAVIRTGGKQYTVKPGDILRVEKLEKDQGDEFAMDEILMVSGKESHLGAPTLSGAKVEVMVTKNDRAKKVLVFKKKRRKGYRKMQGHRQPFTELFVKSITSPDGETESAELKVKAKAPVETKEAAPKKKATKKATTKKATKKKTTKKAASKKAE